MIVDPIVWDWLLVAAAGYAAVASLVYMMREYRRKMIVHCKTVMIKRQINEKKRQEALANRPDLVTVRTEPR